MSAIRYQRFVRHAPTPDELSELVKVDELAERLLEHLTQSAVAIAGVHIFGAQSSSVQAIVPRC